jgi:ankyrin repeat protein
MNPPLAPNQDDLNRQLIDALLQGDVETALALINAGADPNTRYEPNHELLAEFQADKYVSWAWVTVNNSPTAFMLTCGLRLKSTNLSSIPSASVEEYLPLLQAMLAHGVNVHAKALGNLTALHFAAMKARLHTAELLLKCGANVNAHDAGGNTPLMWATWNNTSDLARLLLAHGANPNVPDADGNTSLHGAIRSPIAISVVPELLAYGADPNLCNEKGETPLTLAQWYNRPDLVELLREKGRG